ncbi:MAG: hypothetical protein ACOC1G_05840, partial [Phycisphaeraceae bacterium]
KLEDEADAAVAETGQDADRLDAKLHERFGIHLAEDDRRRLAAQNNGQQPVTSESGKETLQPADARTLFIEKGRSVLRGELTQLERFVLLQILDQAWKDHLYAMDQLKDSVSLRGYAERDPRIEYKREGANHFQQMHKSVRDRVTELIFRARLTPNVQARSAYSQQQQAQHAQPAAATAAAGSAAGASRDAAATSAAAGTADQQADQQAADQAGSGDGGPRQRPVSRKQRRAREARQRKESGGGGHKQRKKKSR